MPITTLRHGCARRGNHHPLYKIWQGMKKRCNNPKHVGYADYGGRGIKLCAEWEQDFVLFYFWARSNSFAEGLQIDRIDNDRGYSPNNCRFVSASENAQNRRSRIPESVDSPAAISIDGEVKHYSEWAMAAGLNPGTVLMRYRRGIRGKALLRTSQRGKTVDSSQGHL